jgi:hypothetical protein
MMLMLKKQSMRFMRIMLNTKMSTTIDDTIVKENFLRSYLREINNFPECSNKQEQTDIRKNKKIF